MKMICDSGKLSSEQKCSNGIRSGNKQVGPTLVVYGLVLFCLGECRVVPFSNHCA
jgi:hypothetical protein